MERSFGIKPQLTYDIRVLLLLVLLGTLQLHCFAPAIAPPLSLLLALLCLASANLSPAPCQRTAAAPAFALAIALLYPRFAPAVAVALPLRCLDLAFCIAPATYAVILILLAHCLLLFVPNLLQSS